MARIIEVRGLTKSFGALCVLDNIDLGFEGGLIHFVLGRSGAGKSVLIKHMVGLLSADRGEVRYDGESVAELDGERLRDLRRRCQLIFQHPTLFEHLSVIDNVAMPLQKRFHKSASESRELAEAALVEVDAQDARELMPTEIGRGVQKRVTVARALALKPETLLYDEPTTGLVPVSARRLDRTIQRACEQRGVTSVVVSHDLSSVEAIAERVVFLSRARVAFDGTSEEWSRCQIPDVVAFRGGDERWRPVQG